MSIYTDLDRSLCCPLCGGTCIDLDEARIAEVPGHRITLVGTCGDCTGRFGLIFTQRGASTRVLATALSRGATASDAVRAYWLGDPEVPGPRPPVEPLRLAPTEAGDSR